MDFFLWMLKVENLHFFHQSDEILHIFMEPFIYGYDILGQPCQEVFSIDEPSYILTN